MNTKTAQSTGILIVSFLKIQFLHGYLSFFCRLVSSTVVIKGHTELILPENEDILLLFISVGSVKFADGQVEKWLIVVGCCFVSGILVETDLPLFEHAEQIYPRLAAGGLES